jgi:hypothetical protein
LKKGTRPKLVHLIRKVDEERERVSEKEIRVTNQPRNQPDICERKSKETQLRE